MEDLGTSWGGVVTLAVAATTTEVALVEDEVVMPMILTMGLEVIMEEDQVMGEAEEDMEVVEVEVQVMGTRVVVGLVAAVMEDTAVITEDMEGVEITMTLEIMVASSPTMGR